MPERAVIVVEPSGTVPADVLTDAIRRRIVDLCGLLIHDVVLVRRGMVARTTSGKLRREATKQRYEQGDLEVAEGQTGLHA
jgi:fatty-acyl-CoA synthase